jgi:1,4-dihydroxy-2-naphthoate octaprenyltransferase
MLILLAGALLLALPPARLVLRGYGEITTALLVSNLIPALAYLFQTGELHRLLAMTTFPLTFLYLAMTLAYELPGYGADVKFDQQTLMVRLGWESGMRLHNLFLLSAYLILGFAMLLGLPIPLGIPGFLTFPLAAFQVYLMVRIAAGTKPNWRVLLFVGAAIYWLTAYLLMFALWTR